MLLKPIISDPASEILREAGIVRPKTSSEGNMLREILDRNDLSLEDAIKELSLLARGSQDESVKLRSIDTALKLHGAMKDDEVSKTPIVNIIIAPLSQAKNDDVIPSILIPRELIESVA